MVFAASAAPIPLYDIYYRNDILTYSHLSFTAVVYFIGAITSLLIFGRLSDHLGRKPVIFIIFGLAATACILLVNLQSPLPLIIARLLLGLACGLASSTITSYIADCSASLPQWIPAAIISNSPMVGLTIGALASGTLVEYGPNPQSLPYLTALAGILICSALIAFSKETVTPAPGLISSLKPGFLLPESSRRFYPVAACIFVCTWALGGFYQAYGPSIAAEQLGSKSALTAAAVFSSFMLSSAIGGPLAARFSPADAQRYGMLGFALSVIGLLISLKLSIITATLTTSAIAGASQGAALTGSIRALLQNIKSQDRAGVLSIIYATSYTGAAVPSLIAGQLSHSMSLFQIATCYGVLAIAGFMITLVFAKDTNPQIEAVITAGVCDQISEK
jgi:MFS family permease